MSSAGLLMRLSFGYDRCAKAAPLGYPTFAVSE